MIHKISKNPQKIKHNLTENFHSKVTLIQKICIKLTKNLYQTIKCNKIIKNQLHINLKNP